MGPAPSKPLLTFKFSNDQRIARRFDEKALKKHEIEAEVATMDFHALSRRQLQVICKRNGIRANMSNAAMAEALQCLPSVDRIDEIVRTASPPMSAVKLWEELTHRSSLPHDGRAWGRTRIPTPDKMEKDVSESDQVTLQGCQSTAAREATVTLESEELIGQELDHGCPLPRSGRARVKTRKAGARKTKEVVPAPHTLQGNQRTLGDAGEEVGAALVDAEEVGAVRRTRRSARLKVKIPLNQKEEVQAAARNEQKANSSDAVIGSEEHEVIAVVDEEVTKPQEGRKLKVTRRATAYKTHEDSQQGHGTAALQAAASVGAEQVSTAKKMIRRSKLAAAARKGWKADSSDTTVGPEVVSYKSCDDLKEDDVVSKVEEASKPHELKKVTRRATEYKAQEEVQPGQVTAGQEVSTAKRRRRRSARSKVGLPPRKGQKADSSDGVNGSAVLVSGQSCDDPKEEQVVQVVQEGVTKPSEEEREEISTVYRSASLVKVEDSPILGVMSNATDTSDKAPVVDEEAVKEDGFTITGQVEKSNLLVNRLDRFAKPIHESIVKREKKDGECWWMLM